jgi:sulfur carrier protein
MGEISSAFSIRLNGQAYEIASGTTLQALLAQLQLSQRRVAVELDGRIVPKSAHAETVLASNAAVEIITAVGGG